MCCLASSNSAFSGCVLSNTSFVLQPGSDAQTTNNYYALGSRAAIYLERQIFDKNEILVNKNLPVKCQHNYFNKFIIDFKTPHNILLFN